MQDYTIILRFGAKDDLDAHRFAKKLNEAIGIGISETNLDVVGRFLEPEGPNPMMLTRWVVSRS